MRIARGPRDGVLRLTATDERGALALSVDAIALSPLPGGAPAADRDDALQALYRVRWTAIAGGPPSNGAAPTLAALSPLELPGAERFAGVAALAATGPAAGTVAVAAPRDVAAALALLHGWLEEKRLHDARLAVLVPGAAAVADGDVPDPAASAIGGLLRSAQTEHPGRFLTIDARSPEEIALAIAAGEAEAAVRDGSVLVRRLVRAPGDAPPSGTWRLAPERAGALIAAAPDHGDGDRPLRSGEIRLAVRAAGVNFRDVLVAIGVHAGRLGCEAAGVVVETAPDVAGLRAGDRVMGIVPGAFGPLAVADARAVAPIPAGWSFAQAASVPVAYATAHLALAETARLRRGDRVLIHAAAGAVGMAAVALAQRLGAEVFATASPAKWDALRALGLDGAHIASSRSPEFAARFEAVDVVLNCLSGELTDASLGLLAGGGRFVELGSTDVRDPAAVAAAHPGVSYETVDLFGTGPERLATILPAALAHGRPLPVTAWDVRDGSHALAFMSQARHVGKVVLTVPHALDPDGTVLVTGGTGGLGAVVAEHLAREHAVRRLLLVSRRGPDAPGVEALRERLAQLGCRATVAACDVGDRAALAKLLETIDPRHPLTAVVHAAGTLDNAMVESLDEARLDGVMRPKANAARWLDELTRGHDLAAFVLFSSVAATFSHPGQGNYAAANAYLDGLAQRRRVAGLAATAVAWGLWGTGSGMSTRLSDEDIEVLAADTGQRVLPAEQALALLDVAIGHREPLLVATTLDRAALRAQAREGVLPVLLSELVPTGRRAGDRSRDRSAAGGASLAQQLAATASAQDRHALVLDLVRAQAAAVLGHASAADVPPDRPLKELGFDSLGSVVLRNRLAQITGLRLPSTLVFDHPTALAMATFVHEQAERERDGDDGHDPRDGQDEGAADFAAPLAGAAAQRQRQPVGAALLAAPAGRPVGPTANGDGTHVRLPARRAADAPAAADRGYRGAVLSSLAATLRNLRFRAWVLKTRARLARLHCRLVVEVDGTPRFDDLPRIVTDAVGEGGGSLTIRIGRDCRFGRELTLDVWTHADSVLEIGDRCQFQDRIRLQPWGGAIRFGAQVRVRDGAELKSKGELVVGADSFIGRNATVHCHERIDLADHVNLAEGVSVMDSDHTHDGSDTYVARQRIVSAPVVVDSNVFVGTNALILRGSHVGRNVMIATGSVLTGGDYPERHLLAGVPAQPLRPLAPDEPIPS